MSVFGQTRKGSVLIWCHKRGHIPFSAVNLALEEENIEPRLIWKQVDMGAYLRMGLRNGLHSQDLFSRG